MAEETNKLLIITADDFGYSDERDDGIIECFKKGVISNVSLMVNGVSCENAAKKAIDAGLPVGLHLNLTEGSPVSTPAPKSLISQDGFMQGMMGQRDAINQGKVDSSEVAIEIQAQIDKFERLMGQKPVNVDGHQHIHLYPGICEIFSKILQKNGITLTRIPIESEFSKTSDDPKAEFLGQVIQNAKDSVEILKAHAIWAPSFTGLKTMGSYMSVLTLTENITEGFQHGTNPDSRNPVCELMVHPGRRTGNFGGCGDGPDWFSQSEEREHEMAMLQSDKLLSFYKKNGIKLVSFQDIL